MFLSCLSLKNTKSLKAIMALLDPNDAGRSQDADHRLVWSTFASSPDQRRDFLFRREADGKIYTLSPRAPVESEVIAVETKPFKPMLKKGDVLTIRLRANATVNRTAAPGQKSRKHDVVMDHIKANGLPNSARSTVAAEVGPQWLKEQGKSAGFDLLAADVKSYETVAVPGAQGSRKSSPQFSVMELEGVIRVNDPELLLERQSKGFGGARAFGCGLMLLARAA